MKIVFQDPTFSSQLLRTISQTYYGGADIGVSHLILMAERLD